MTLYTTPPWRGHRFPHKRITTRAAAARRSYLCAAHDSDRSPDCARDIEPGEHYLRVSFRDGPGGRSGRRRHVHLCAACAIGLQLAQREQPEGFAR